MPPAGEPQLLGHAPHVLARVRRYRIVAGIDLSEYADIVLEHALDQAARHQAPELHLLTVRERPRPSADELQHMLWDRVYSPLEAFNQYGADWRARLHVRRGKPEEQIAQLAAELQADLIVIGQFGLHHRKPTIKSVPNRVLQAAVCPTLVVGMPAAADTSPRCALCCAVREDTDGERWFCAHHADSTRDVEPTTTPMTTWSGGALVYR